ncbi:MAG: alkaline phosphatase family protein [Candidatus Moduliflexus flocculans]|nr:alkaline phosphatase family protein [Candidatus Moduliflexus flocculans]
MPSNYPPVESKQRTLAGMNTPDLKGSYGIFSYYTNDSTAVVQEAGGGGRVHRRLRRRQPGRGRAHRARSNTFRTDAPGGVRPLPGLPRSRRTRRPRSSSRARSSSCASGSGAAGSASASASCPTQSVHGICLFYLKEVRPKFKLYVSPIHMDPARPALPISTPESYARELERRFGPYFTKGLPADTSALENGVLDEEEFLALDNKVYEESMAMLEYELGRFDEGLLFYYFSNADQRQHMFWRLTDPGHPAYDEKLAARFGDVIARTYGEMDRALDLALGKADKDTVVLVMSDHGFNTFRRGFNLNTWLVREGYHRLQEALEAGGVGLLRQHGLGQDPGLRHGPQQPLHQREGPRGRGRGRARGRTRTTSSGRSPASSRP